METNNIIRKRSGRSSGVDEDFEKIKLAISKWFDNHAFVEERDELKLSQPNFDPHEIIAICKSLLLSNGWIAQGKYVRRFEKLFAKYVGTKEAIATNSGSSANLLAIAALIENKKLKPGDEVIVPAAAFPTVATCVVQLGLKLVFVDVNIDGNINPIEIKKALSKKTKMVIVVHTLGKPAQIRQVQQIIKNKNIFLLEDCCEAHGTMVGKKKVGSYGDIATFSFYVAHNMTTGEGGMVVTNSSDLTIILRSLREFGRYKSGKQEGRFSHYDQVLGNYDTQQLFTRLGYNLRMTDMQAAIGIEQLKKLDVMNKKRKKIVMRYLQGIMNFKYLMYLPEIEKNTVHTYYGFLLIIKKNAPFSREELSSFLEKAKIETRPLFGGCLPDQPAFRTVNKKVVGDLNVSRLIRDRAIFVGCHPSLTVKQINKFITKINSFINARI